MALTPQQESFAQAVAAGKSQAEAYRTAYPRSQDWKPDAVYCAGSKLMADTKVLERVAAIRAELASRGLWTREQSVQVLATIAMNGKKEGDRVRAVNELNAMHGFRAAEKIDLTFESKPDEELESRIAELLGKAGAGKAAG